MNNPLKGTIGFPLKSMFTIINISKFGHGYQGKYCM